MGGANQFAGRLVFQQVIGDLRIGADGLAAVENGDLPNRSPLGRPGFLNQFEFFGLDNHLFFIAGRRSVLTHAEGLHDPIRLEREGHVTHLAILQRLIGTMELGRNLHPLGGFCTLDPEPKFPVVRAQIHFRLAAART